MKKITEENKANIHKLSQTICESCDGYGNAEVLLALQAAFYYVGENVNLSKHEIQGIILNFIPLFEEEEE